MMKGEMPCSILFQLVVLNGGTDCRRTRFPALAFKRPRPFPSAFHLTGSSPALPRPLDQARPRNTLHRSRERREEGKGRTKLAVLRCSSPLRQVVARINTNRNDATMQMVLVISLPLVALVIIVAIIICILCR